MLRVLFPHLDGLVIGAVRDVDSTVRIDAATGNESVGCPSCSTPSRPVTLTHDTPGIYSRVHSAPRRGIMRVVPVLTSDFTGAADG